MKPKVKFYFKDGFGYLESKDSRQYELLRSMFYDNITIYKNRKKKVVKVYSITPSGKFNVGFFKNIYDRIRHSHDVTIDKSLKLALVPPTNLDGKKISQFENISYTPYQTEAIESMIIKGRGIVELGTSGGKSYICAGFAKTVIDQTDNKVLIIVPGLSLVNQLYNDFVDKFSISEVTILTSKQIDDYDSTKRIVITNSECLISQIKKDQHKEVLDFDFVIVDECHKINKDTWISAILSKMKTQKRFGLTATLPDVGADYHNIIGKIGNVIYSKSAKSLRDDNYISQLKITMFLLEHSKKPKYPRVDDPLVIYQFEKKWLMECQRRNDFICALAKSFKNTSLILVDNILYGNNITDMLIKKGIKCEFIRGSTSIEDRERIQKSMESQDDLVIVAMDRIFSTGISINNIHNVVFALIGKAKIKIIQSIGRSLRKNHNKLHSSIFDVCDNLTISKKHANARYELYQKEVDNVKVKKYIV